MPQQECPNIETCRVVHSFDLVNDPSQRELYLATYCYAGEAGWSTCKRLQTKMALKLCPDFVLPDSDFSVEQILDRLEK
jgi:hypothetical protein